MESSVVDGLVTVGSAVLALVVVASWLATYCAPQAAPVGSSRWFTWPAWAQVGAGFGVIVLFSGVGYLLWIPLPLNASPAVSALLCLIGLAVFLAGLLLALWARWVLGEMYGVSTSSAALLRARHRLFQHGPYAFVRHPMYLGYWRLLSGITLVYCTWTPLLLLVMCLASFYRRARREEQVLAETFGVEWQGYKARTKFLIPWMY